MNEPKKLEVSYVEEDVTEIEYYDSVKITRRKRIIQ